MIKINVKHIDENAVDGLAEIFLKDNESWGKISVILPSLSSDGIRVYHDGRLQESHLEEHHLKPIFTDEIQINITGWFYIHYELHIELKEEYTHIYITYKGK